MNLSDASMTAVKGRIDDHGSAGWPHSGVALTVGDASDVATLPTAPAAGTAGVSVLVCPVVIEPAFMRRLVELPPGPYPWMASAAIAATAHPPTTAAPRRIGGAGRCCVEALIRMSSFLHRWRRALFGPAAVHSRTAGEHESTLRNNASRELLRNR